MRYPKFLEKGGTIGFVAPSFGCNIEPYRTAFGHALDTFHAKGYQTELGPNCYEGCGIGISNTPEKCGQEINEMYTSKKNDVLISCGGGELMCETLDHIDSERLKKADPKWFVGYSDNTNLTYLLTTICDTASVYGPCAAAFGMEPWHASIEDTFALLCGEKKSLQGYRGYEKESLKDEEHPLAPYNITEQKELHLYETDATHGSTTVDEVFMAGRLIGGCMDCLVNLLGTKFDKTTDFLEHYKEDGFIWFLEACDLNVMAIRRAMWQMEHAGWFRYVKGFLIGRPLVHGQEMMGLDQYHAVLDIIAHHNVPVIMDADLGHIAPMLPLISGSYANITATGNNLVVDMKLK